MTANRFPHDTEHDGEDGLEAEWKRQERILRGLRDGVALPTEADDAADRALFAALAREPLPPPPADFAQRAAAAADRQAMARRQVARFRRLLGVLLGVCYLPAMSIVALMYLPKIWTSSPPPADAASLGAWLIAIVALALLSLIADRWRLGSGV